MSLKEIIYDLLNIIRGSKITDNEPISERQIEEWIHQYRALYLKRDLDKNKYPNPDYIQSIDCLELVPEDLAGSTSSISTGVKVYKTSVKIPNTLDLNRKSGITFIGDLYNNRIQLVPESRVNFQAYKKFTPYVSLAYLRDNYIYIHNTKELQYITLRGIFENPSDLSSLTNGCTNTPIYTTNSEYPFPVDKLPSLKTDILKNELGIEWNSPTDDINDDAHINLDTDIKK